MERQANESETDKKNKSNLRREGERTKDTNGKNVKSEKYECARFKERGRNDG